MDLLLGISNGNLAITAVITGLGLVRYPHPWRFDDSV